MTRAVPPLADQDHEERLASLDSFRGLHHFSSLTLHGESGNFIRELVIQEAELYVNVVVLKEVEQYDIDLTEALSRVQSHKEEAQGLPVDGQPEPSESVYLRLVNGGSRCAGRVEIRYNGNWGTVDHDDWDLPDATVVCRELGCGAALKALKNAKFGKGSGPVLTSNVKCHGKESAFKDCKSPPWGDIGYRHDWDAGVICQDHRAVKLEAGNDECSGRVEVEFAEIWGTMCDQHWDWSNSNVVCNQLQCGVAVSVLGGAYFGEGTGPISNNVLRCQGNESSLSDCSVGSRTDNCTHKNDVSLNCSGKDGPRLVGGESRCSGRVEVLHGDQWGTLCDEYFNLEDAAVVCEQLQCGAVNDTPIGAHFGKGNGPMWKDNYRCLGKESRLADCPVSAWGQNSCSHGNDAGLRCTGESQIMWN
ncbi:scavenger receptor cysteine-rich type 1 protein M130-like [Mobula hypostoma]|uniref:scavenger receptor cysteine-rich type 1 protein M130-like n=1 Tax=Mobula hypostoma TaxID=723540 RepID=UPI002FC322B3